MLYMFFFESEASAWPPGWQRPSRKTIQAKGLQRLRWLTVGQNPHNESLGHEDIPSMRPFKNCKHSYWIGIWGCCDEEYQHNTSLQLVIEDNPLKMGVSAIHSYCKSQRNPLHPYLSCIRKISTRLRKDRQHISGRKINPLRHWGANTSKSCSFQTIAHADWSKPCRIETSIREMRSIFRLWAWSLVLVFGKEKHLAMKEICTLSGCPVIV